jgi:H+/Cl- antiporter ClcA
MTQVQFYKIFKISFLWIVICTLIALFVGTASAFFLSSLDWATEIRNTTTWMVLLLPFGGLFIGLIYHYWGKDVSGGNNLILDEIEKPRKKISFVMAPLVLVGTLMTHLVGGSAGREGTAVQIGSAISDVFSKYFNIDSDSRKLLLLMGISAGFAAVFGTPWAGFIFAFEINKLSKKNYWFMIPLLFVAFGSDFVCDAWQISHTAYIQPKLPPFSFILMGKIIISSIIFGLFAWLFSINMNFWKIKFQQLITYPPFRPMLGGFVLMSVFILLPDTRQYQGLGITTIQNSFLTAGFISVVILKLVLTGFTLGAGFKGGEVTPLFFIGAVLGSSLTHIFFIPVAFMASIGFVAVFAGATHTPWASTAMGMELFGWELGGYFMIVCWIANLFSGQNGIYESQKIGGLKALVYQKLNIFQTQLKKGFNERH